MSRPPGPVLDSRLQLERRTPECLRLGGPVLEGHLLDRPRLVALQLEHQAVEVRGLHRPVLLLEGRALEDPVLGVTVRCQALLLMTASKALTKAFSNGIMEEHKDLTGPEDPRDPRDPRDHREHQVSPDHKVSQVSPDCPDYKDSRDHKASRDHRDCPARKASPGCLDHRDHKGLRGSLDRRDRGDHEGGQGQGAMAPMLHQTFCLKATISSLKA